ncbi:hypothetical protein ABZ383_08465 [Streptomyces sp. NPDC005900]|uniref:hypothetical protein n=1 Tax=Streptomyces sp. NPDC005900 TaxID=3154569 RepID=UPI0033D20AD5
MRQRMSRRALLAVGVVMTVVPVSAVHAAVAKPTPPQLEEKEVDVPVVNGSFSQPSIAIGSKKEWEQVDGTAPLYWGRQTADSAAGVVVAAGKYRAGRGERGQAVRVDALLAADGDLPVGTGKHLKTRLWDVRQGSRITLRFAYSPTTNAEKCKSTGKDKDPKEEQRKQIQLHVLNEKEHVWDGTVEAPTFTKRTFDNGKKKEEFEVGEAKWKEVELQYTAKTDNPRVAFALTDVKYGKDEKNQKDVSAECHPMIAAVSARQRPIEVDKSSRKSDLPPAKAYQGNDYTGDVSAALDACADTANRCTFTLNQRYSYGYYDRPRPVGEVYENCTFSESQASAALRDRRRVVYRERSFDSGTQAGKTQFLDSSSHDGLTGEDLSHDVSHVAPKEPGVAKDKEQAVPGAAAVHFAAAYEKVRDQPWQWSRTVERDIDVVTPKNHASWVEVSAARERADGHYTVTDKTGSQDAGSSNKAIHRLFITYDGPSRITSDRVFQRHGTLSPTEIARCKTHRPLPYTPAEDPVVPYDPKDRDVPDESLTPGTAVSARPKPNPSASAS